MHDAKGVSMAGPKARIAVAEPRVPERICEKEDPTIRASCQRAVPPQQSQDNILAGNDQVYEERYSKHRGIQHERKLISSPARYVRAEDSHRYQHGRHNQCGLGLGQENQAQWENCLNGHREHLASAGYKAKWETREKKE